MELNESIISPSAKMTTRMSCVTIIIEARSIHSSSNEHSETSPDELAFRRVTNKIGNARKDEVMNAIRVPAAIKTVPTTMTIGGVEAPRNRTRGSLVKGHAQEQLVQTDGEEIVAAKSDQEVDHEKMDVEEIVANSS